MCWQSKKGAINPQGEKPGVKVKETRGDIPNFCVGVRDPGSYLEFLCGCKRPGERSQIFVWV